MTLDHTPTPAADGPSHRSRRTLLTSAAVVAVLALGAGIGAQLPAWTAGANAAPISVQPATASGQTLTFADLIAKVQPAVVSVKVEMAAQPVSSTGLPLQRFFQFGQPDMPSPQQALVGEGSGFFISADGYAVTANHVVDHAKAVEITTSDGKTYKAHVVGADAATDVALIKVDAHQNFTFVKFADKAPRVGDWVVAIGNPYGLGDTATAGIVSALSRNIGSSTYDNYIQIDAPINKGNSGGPTFDVNGNVVGINDAIYSPSGGSVGIGFDIPADIAKTVAASLQTSGHVTRGWLGVQVQDVTQSIADSLGMKQAAGALVAAPEDGSPAAKAGIRPGDVITAVNGTTVKDGRELAQQVAGLAPGTSVKLDVLHGDKTRTVTLALGEMPNQPQSPPA